MDEVNIIEDEITALKYDKRNELKVFTFTATLDDLVERYNQIVNKVEPICQNCKYWEPSPYAVNYGTCGLSKMRTCNTKIVMMSSGCGLKTHKTFGCNQFLNK